MPPVSNPSSLVSNCVGEHVGDPEEARDRVDLDGQRRRAEHHGVAAGHVCPHQLTHLGVDPALDPLGEQPLADLVQIAQQPPAQRRRRLADEVFELDAPERVVQAGLNHAEQLAHPHVAAPQPLLGEDDGGEAGDQRPVQVEKRTDLAAPGDWPGSRRPSRATAGPARGLGCSERTHEPDADRDAESARSANDAGTARGAGSPARARISSKPSSRHWANTASFRTDARS